MKKVCLYLIVVSILLVGASAQAATRTEDFTTAPAGWTSNSSLGWTANMSGSGAWGGGEVFSDPAQGTRKYYADLDLGGSFDLSQDIQFTTDYRVEWNGDGTYYTDADAFIGFFDSTATGTVGDLMAGPALGIHMPQKGRGGDLAAYIRGYVGLADGTIIQDSANSAQIVASGEQRYTINLSWTASTRTLAWSVTHPSLTVVDRNGDDAVEQFLTLTQTQVDALGGSFNAFGISNFEDVSTPGQAWTEVWMDDATYTIVPEPISMLLLGSGAVMTLLRRKRR